MVNKQTKNSLRQTNKQNIKQNVNVKVHVGDVKKKRKYRRKTNNKSEPKGNSSTIPSSYTQPYHPVYIQSGTGHSSLAPEGRYPNNYEPNNQDKPSSLWSNPLLKAIEELTNKIHVNYQQPQRVNSLLASATGQINQPRDLRDDYAAYAASPRGTYADSAVDDNSTLQNEPFSDDDNDFSISHIGRLRTIKPSANLPNVDQPFSNPRHIADGYYNLPDGTIQKMENAVFPFPSSPFPSARANALRDQRSPIDFDYARENPLLVEHSESIKRAGGGGGYRDDDRVVELSDQPLENEVLPLNNTIVERRRGRPPVAKSRQQLEEERLAKNERARMRRQAAKMKHDEQKLWDSKRK